VARGEGVAVGTNYYWRHNICFCCNRSDEWHICKSLISFEGHFSEGEWDDAAKAWPDIPVITSWRDWVTKLTSGGEIWDEYSVQHDTEEFIARVEATDRAARRRQYDWCMNHPDRLGGIRVGSVGPRSYWLDADGFSFYGGEFS
jgi:hypothetical protein